MMEMMIQEVLSSHNIGKKCETSKCSDHWRMKSITFMIVCKIKFIVFNTFLENSGSLRHLAFCCIVKEWNIFSIWMVAIFVNIHELKACGICVCQIKIFNMRITGQTPYWNDISELSWFAPFSMEKFEQHKLLIVHETQHVIGQ